MSETSISSTLNPSADLLPARRRRRFFPFWYALLSLLIASIVALAVLPPLLNVNRFKRRIVTSISTSLGRPVHLDSVTLVLLPFPGFKLENFVVAEDPAFGSEPVMRANEVEATLRIASLYSKKVEFSKISLKEPSINLVHAESGQWNVESILLKASQISAAPTVQTTVGPDPRFPYIEATEARVNIKSGVEKLPFSITEADFALWLPQPQQWRIRVSGKPTRTDTSASDTGTFSLEGSLGRAERLDLIPIDLAAEWKNAPLGEASRVLTGRDAGIRGDLKLNLAVRGTVGTSLIKTTLDLRGLRRADFVPDRLLDIRADCQATAAETFHALRQIRCIWPSTGDPTLVAFTGDLPVLRDPTSASFELGTPGLPAAVLLQWLRAASPRVSPDISASGTITGAFNREPVGATSGFSDIGKGQLTSKGVQLSGKALGDTTITVGDTMVSSESTNEIPAHISSGILARQSIPKTAKVEVKTRQLVMQPTSISLGGREPAFLEGRFDKVGYSLHLSGNVLPSRLLALAAAVPQFGDGLPTLFPPVPQAAPAKEVPVHVDLTSVRLWGGGQSWLRVAAAKPPRPPSRRH